MKCAFVVDFCLTACIPGATPNFLNPCGGQRPGAAPLAVCCRNQHRYLRTSACHELGLKTTTNSPLARTRAHLRAISSTNKHAVLLAPLRGRLPPCPRALRGIAAREYPLQASSVLQIGQRRQRREPRSWVGIRTGRGREHPGAPTDIIPNANLKTTFYIYTV